ncbi:menaquinone biosynthesis decarboxylase [Helicobacter sp. 16-1353]|uniref:menaquinone biosynthesis decarboxylase n=1 Tax=Helicobacter sp. 16-1353 TaxID=2004996 RepID=UPI000DCF60EB|nr:menaquinone biosynthesis decarboxylase [Helicobacter sp. 16-1353]RAX54020.1 menaquinone biosynthesis decarboxylase [Helicobacter sp. 16-1353]
MQNIIEFLKTHNEIRIIDDELDIELEIPHIAYIEVKKPDSKALLFTNPISKRLNKKYEMPVLMNLFGSFNRLDLLFPNHQNIAGDIEKLLKFTAPSGFKDSLSKLKNILNFRHIFPKKVKKNLQEVVHLGENVDLESLPILKTWESDGGAFITMGQVYTQSLDGKIKNLGMYRLQVFDKNHLGMHWQIHKDSTNFFSEYKRAGRKMPVSIAIGGDPLYTWCGQAPMPYGMYELMLYGLFRKSRPKVAKCLTNDLFVPYDCDIVLEGFVDTEKFVLEGPFGDHTGFYTPIEPYPVMEVTAIRTIKKPIYLATVVGKPPLEDKYMGYMTERIFLPLLKTTTPALVDYYMPENGVFHNLILAKIDPKYPAHAKQIMHGFWGVGQMSFVKHAIFVPKSAPELSDNLAITEYILNHLDINDLLISFGICDALDHSSPHYAQGGKLGIDCTLAEFGSECAGGNPKNLRDSAESAESKGESAELKAESVDFKNLDSTNLEILSDLELLAKIKRDYSEVADLRQYFTHTKNPLTIILIDKKTRVLDHIDAFNPRHCKIVFALDSENNDLENLYMLLWRIVNNIDASRDIGIKNGIALIDATKKGELEGHLREWPKDVVCTRAIVEGLVERGILERDEELWKKYQIF